MQRNKPQNIGIGINIHCPALLGRPFAASLGMTTTSHRHQAHHGHVVRINIISLYHFHHRPDQSFAWKPSTAPPATVQSQNKRCSCNLCGQINPITPILQQLPSGYPPKLASPSQQNTSQYILSSQSSETPKRIRPQVKSSVTDYLAAP